MRRANSKVDFDEILRAAMAPVIARASAAIAKAVVEMTEERVAGEIAAQAKARGGRGRKTSARRPRRNVEMTAWTADRRARRVPTFVIEATGLDTKKKIVAKYGEGATFHRGKPLPPLKKEGGEGGASGKDATAARVVKAKPPRIRKASAA